MEKKYPVAGVDIAKNFCYYSVLSPLGKTYLKPFKELNDKNGLFSVVKKLEKVEKVFGEKPVIVMESTGHYSLRLIHFFIRNGFKVFLINPLQSHSIKNSTIRKVKTDKVDCEELARLFFLQNLREFNLPDTYFSNLKVLSRTHFHLSEQRTLIMNQLESAIDQVLPGFTDVFQKLSSNAALEVLISYNSPDAILKADRQEVIKIIKSLSRRSADFATKKYDMLIKCAQDAKHTGVLLDGFYQSISIYAQNLKHINEQIKKVADLVKELSVNIESISLLNSIPGIGKKLAPIIAAEIGDISRFKSAKQLVAYSGIDPSVRQSGNFVGSNNKFTKRGSYYLRKALYIAASVSVSTNTDGSYVNKVLYDYYHKKIQSKAKKQALGAIMNKLVHIIFSVLKNKRSFVQITPEEQVKLYKNSIRVVA